MQTFMQTKKNDEFLGTLDVEERSSRIWTEHCKNN